LKVDHLLHEKPEPEYRFPGKTRLRHQSSSRNRKLWVVNAAMLDPTWAPTNNPLAAPAIASPMRSRTCSNFLTEDRIVVTNR
jgi:hypothetical protein